MIKEHRLIITRFRQYLNLKPYESFEEWCEDKDTARAAELLYSHIDNLELYPGLMAECTKPPIPGSGVCPGQTTGRGILDDAVALVRGDRFLSYDFNSNTLTNWGASKLGDIPGGAYGGMLPKIIFNGLPTAFTGTSSYALMPFYTPKAVAGMLKANKVIDKYDLQRPRSDGAPVAVHTQEGCKHVLGDTESFRVVNASAVRPCATNSNKRDSVMKLDGPKIHEDRLDTLQHIFLESGFEANVTKFFRAKAAQLISQCSLKYHTARRSIDIVRDVANVVPVMWLAERSAIPIKSPTTPHGLLAIPELLDIYQVISMYQSFNISPINEWKLREGSNDGTSTLRKILEAHLKTQQGFKEKIVDWMAKDSAYEVGPDADRIFHALNKTKLPMDSLVDACIRMAAPVAGNITQQASLLIDLFLSQGYEQYKERIIELAHQDDEASDREMQGFVFEGIRHANAVPGLPLVATKPTTIQDGARGAVHVNADHTVFLATSLSAMDPATFPEPEKLNPHRPVEDYALLTRSLHPYYGARFVGPSIAAILKEVFKLKNLRRAKGRAGRFTKIEYEIAGVKTIQYLDANAKESPIPTTLSLEYDA